VYRVSRAAALRAQISMRLWTLHPRYLDPNGLVAAWREALLAQKVLTGATQGYRHHPQLVRFQEQSEPVAAIAAFLAGIAEEAQSRDYRFDTSKISRWRCAGQIAETSGQLLYEWDHLKIKLQRRAPQLGIQLRSVAIPEPHPLFRIVSGDVRTWEKQRI
jgi:Pyrimidine dimer DNA glycosylase